MKLKEPGRMLQQEDMLWNRLKNLKGNSRNLSSKRAIAADVVIATAQIPGKKAPVLILKETVMAMKPGSVIVDLAASSGGNCELTQNDRTITVNGVTIIGKSDLSFRYAILMPVRCLDPILSTFLR